MNAETNPQVRGGNAQAQLGQPRVISHPDDVANLVLLQIDAVSVKKDELTIALKTLTDTAKQLVRAYSEHTGTIQVLRQKLEELESPKP